MSSCRFLCQGKYSWLNVSFQASNTIKTNYGNPRKIKDWFRIFFFSFSDIDMFYKDSKDKKDVAEKDIRLRQTNMQVPNPLQKFRAIPMYRR